MHYRLLIIVISLTFLSGQSLFNRFVGTDPFTGSARSTAMGNTHLLNSTGSTNIRFNPSNLVRMNSRGGINLQTNHSSVFERWSMPMKDFFGDFLTSGDYVTNEFSYYGINSGVFASLMLPMVGKVGAGFHYAPLTHFTYQYSEEVRGEYDTEDGEYASKDPFVGYQNLSIDGNPMVISLGGGIQLNMLQENNLSIGMALNIVQSTKVTDEVSVDTLYSDVTNLSTLPDMNSTAEMPTTNFINCSSTLNLTSHVELGVSWEQEAKTTTTQYSWSIDSTNGLFQYFEDSSYVTKGMNYVKPAIFSMALSYISNLENIISINFELDRVSYNNHLNLKDYNQYKFGFEYLTPMGTPIRGGLVYRQAVIPAMKPISMFTFGTGKTIGNMVIDAAGTYCFQSFYYPDLFLVKGDIRTDYDLVRDSQLNLQLGLTYQF